MKCGGEKIVIGCWRTRECDNNGEYKEETGSEEWDDAVGGKFDTCCQNWNRNVDRKGDSFQTLNGRVTSGSFVLVLILSSELVRTSTHWPSASVSDLTNFTSWRKLQETEQRRISWSIFHTEYYPGVVDGHVTFNGLRAGGNWVLVRKLEGSKFLGKSRLRW